MTTTSAIPAAIGYCVDQFTTAPTLGASTTAELKVIYCNYIGNDYPKRSLWIAGGDPAASGGAVSGATGQQNWAALGARARDEQISLLCYAEVWTGDEGNMRGAVEDAFSIVAAVENVTRNDIGLGGAISFLKDGVTNLDLRHGQSKVGPVAQVLFNIDCYSRISLLGS